MVVSEGVTLLLSVGSYLTARRCLVIHGSS